MIGLGELVSACSFGLSLLKKGVDVWSKRLSDEEKQLLIAAAESPDFHVCTPDQRTYPAIKAGRQWITPDDDDLASAKLWDALKSLCERGAIEIESHNQREAHLRLTSSGLEKARQLAGAGDQAP